MSKALALFAVAVTVLTAGARPIRAQTVAPPATVQTEEVTQEEDKASFTVPPGTEKLRLKVSAKSFAEACGGCASFGDWSLSLAGQSTQVNNGRTLTGLEGGINIDLRFRPLADGLNLRLAGALGPGRYAGKMLTTKTGFAGLHYRPRGDALALGFGARVRNAGDLQQTILGEAQMEVKVSKGFFLAGTVGIGRSSFSVERVIPLNWPATLRDPPREWVVREDFAWGFTLGGGYRFGY
ncbi:MAG: hypothetical protein Q7S66_01555 [bacterium]|nr:hypothetical protein [bacterium]